MSGNRSYQGRTVDISRGGMKIIADTPESPRTVETIEFVLPKSEKPLHIPCKLVRRERLRSDAKRQILGIEFSFEEEAQMILIESFIREKKLMQLKTQERRADNRQVPRTDCVIHQVSCDREGIRVLSIDNMSVDGVLISFRGEGLRSRDRLSLTFKLPGDAREITILGAVAYVKENVFMDSSNAGIVFDAISELDRIRIKNFISTYTVAMAVKTLHEKFSAFDMDDRYKVRDAARIHSLFSQIIKEQVYMNVLFEDDYKLQEMPVLSYDRNNKIFSLDKRALSSNLCRRKVLTAYFSFSMQNGTYYFKTNLRKIHGRHAFFPLPEAIYQSEKRSHQRKITGENIVFTQVPEDEPERSLQGTIINMSRHGFMCELPLEKESKDFFQPGRIAHYRTHEKWGLGTYGEIRHVTESFAPDGQKMLKVGIESGMKHKPYRFLSYAQEEWDSQKLYQEVLPPSAREKINSMLVKYPNKKGQQIAALVNATHKKITAPVIVLPPAFGKKKESLSPLVSTLMTNARFFGKDMVSIRYDGINRPGESYNEEMVAKRGYEMLYYRISQGQDDLQATLDYIHDNSLFKPSRVIVIAFSMSALDVRRLVARSHDPRIDLVINVMGVSCGQSAFRNMTGGLDIIGYYTLGIQSGLFGILGHVLDLDNLAEDLIEQRYAYMTDARLDMSKIAVPLLWIYGKYDKWIDENEVKELMEVDSPGTRELIEIPTGHNIRSSEDAIKTFKILTSWIHEKLYGEKITPVDPDRENLVNLIAYERERTVSLERFNSEEYWKEYLIGRGRNSFGYDFYKNIKEFRDFLTFQSRLAGLKERETLVDMGCGTGLLVENMLDLAAKEQRDIRNTEIIMIDLIPEALDKTKSKVERIQKRHGAMLPERMSYEAKDLEPNRLIPVHRFMEDRDLDFDFLRNRIEGLPNTVIDRFMNRPSKRLYEIMRGASMNRSDEVYIESAFKEEECRMIEEFNRAARFLKNKLELEDFVEPELGRSALFDAQKYGRLQTSDLKFFELNFGQNGLRLHLDFKKESFDKIIASLFISYLFNPEEIFHDFYRMLKPDGLLLVSSMKPDSDISLIFTDYVDKIQHFDFSDTAIKSQDMSLMGAREMLNEAAALFELEEEGYFKFFSDRELVHMFRASGFGDIQAYSSLGDPPQAIIVTGKKI